MLSRLSLDRMVQSVRSPPSRMVNVRGLYLGEDMGDADEEGSLMRSFFLCMKWLHVRNPYVDRLEDVQRLCMGHE